MRQELQAYLDGELELNELPAELREEAQRWERLLGDMRTATPHGAPAGLENRVRRALPARRRSPAWRRGASWIVRPRTIRISPLAGLAAAAALALFVFLPKGEAPSPAQGPRDGATTYVQFVLEAPGASSVAVSGDFNEWSADLVLSDHDGDGVWTGRAAVEPGVHQYMFLIDGSQWTTDPHADRYMDDGFGNRNAVLVIAEPAIQS